LWMKQTAIRTLEHKQKLKPKKNKSYILNNRW
jgi:hypothetical protein